MSEQQDQRPEVFAPGAFDGLDGTEVPLKGPDEKPQLPPAAVAAEAFRAIGEDLNRAAVVEAERFRAAFPDASVLSTCLYLMRVRRWADRA